jgi:hypothetical protein
MRIASLVIGIIGAIVLLLICWVGFMIGSVAHSDQYKIISTTLPILALVGVGTVMSKPVVGASLMAASVIGFLAWVGTLNGVTMLPTMLLGVAALLGFIGAGEVKKP